VPLCSDEERPPVCDRIREAEPAPDLMQVSRRIGFRFGAYVIGQSPSCHRQACSGNPAQDAAGPDFGMAGDKPGQRELLRVLPCYLVRGRRRCRIWGKMRSFSGMACSIEAFRTIGGSLLNNTHSGISSRADKNTMSNLKLIGTRPQMRRSSNRLGSPRKDGLLRDQPRSVQLIDGESVSMALAGMSRRRSNSFDKAQANCGCTNLWKGRGLFG
jgi:hypothetical protein